MTDAEKVERCLEHIKECHNAFDALHIMFLQALKREYGERDFTVHPTDYVGMYYQMTQVFPSRPKQAIERRMG